MAVRPMFAVLLFVCATVLVPAQSGDNLYVVRNVRVFDGESIAERQTVVISEGKSPRWAPRLRCRQALRKLPAKDARCSRA
jgi:hypothetical protein